jgi:hypothetical protein
MTMAQHDPSKQQGSAQPPERGKARDTATPGAPQDVEKDDVHSAPESGEKSEASSGSDQPRDPDEI